MKNVTVSWKINNPIVVNHAKYTLIQTKEQKFES